VPADKRLGVRSSLVTGRVDLKPRGVGVEASGELQLVGAEMRPVDRLPDVIGRVLVLMAFPPAVGPE
jgi:hypothetical protein